MILIYPGQHWPPEPDDLNYARVWEAPVVGCWAVDKKTPACAWTNYYPTKEKADEALAQFHEDCGLTPAARAARKLLHRTKLQAQKAALEQELAALDEQP